MKEVLTAFTSARTDTPLGEFHLLFEREKLVYAGFSDPVRPGVRLPALLHRRISALQPAAGHPEQVQQAIRQIRRYFSGEPVSFDIPLKLYGSPFQLAVWNRLLRIPAGSTSTYSRVAAECGYPRAVRAVGSAVGSNPISVIVPCHRVLPASGAIGNYGGGPDKKEYLLNLEHAFG